MDYYLLLYTTILYPIIYIFPAYAANGAPVLFGRGSPLDRKKKINGKRIFGDNKTVRGLVASLICGIIVGLIEFPFFPYMLPISVLLAVGANVGDLLGSFMKRQANEQIGRGVPILDQYGFFVAAILLAAPLGHLPNIYGIAFLVALTGILHVLTNRGAHLLRLKKVPW